MQLWYAPLDSSDPHRLTYGDASYEGPDMDRNGRIVASRRYIHFDIWKYPVDGKPADNVSRGVRITHQTGKVQTPSVSPGDKEVAYLSDSGGHGNVWVINLITGEKRQITSEKGSVTVGLPLWSPDGKGIAFATTTYNEGFIVEYWIVSPDGSNLRRVIQDGAWASWSGDSHWLYYVSGPLGRFTDLTQMYKVQIEGGTPILVRERSKWVLAPAPAPDGSALYFIMPLQNVNGSLDFEVRVARPENGPDHTLLHISGNRVPNWQGLHPVISPDGKWMALPLNDNLGTNLWLISTTDGSMRRVTDFGDRRTYIARRVSWSSDGKFIFASLGEGDADIVELDGLLP